MREDNDRGGRKAQPESSFPSGSLHSSDNAGNSKEGNEPPPINIKLRNLDDGEHEIKIVRDAEVLDYPFFSGTLNIEGTLTKAGTRFHLDAEAASIGQFECTRCTEPFSRVITAPLDLVFVPPGLVRDLEDPNIHAYDPLASAYVDITQDVRDALALAIPMKNLCRPDCKGLCLTCGKNLNFRPCSCGSDEDPIEKLPGNWTALKGLSERLRAEEGKC